MRAALLSGADKEDTKQQMLLQLFSYDEYTTTIVSQIVGQDNGARTKKKYTLFLALLSSTCRRGKKELSLCAARKDSLMA